jgi:long-chain acyl-CoA synthetase
MDRRKFVLAAAAVATLFWAAPASAAHVDQVKFEDRLKAGSIMLRLQGYGLAYYKVVFKGLAAGLYIDESKQPEDALGDVAKRLEMEYFWALKAETLVAASEKLLADNLSSEELARLRPKIDELHSYFTDVKPGDRCSLTYMPGVGTWFTQNGKIVGTVPGPELGQAYFAIWLGDKPMDAKLKRQLLGGK